MNSVNKPENTNEDAQLQRWDELDQRFWEIYKTIDEGKLHRTFRRVRIGGMAILGLDLFAAILLLAMDLSSFLGWMFALFMFGCAFLFIKQIRRDAAVWDPEEGSP